MQNQAIQQRLNNDPDINHLDYWSLAPVAVAAALAAEVNAGLLPKVEGYSAGGKPFYASAAVAQSLAVTVEYAVQMLKSMPLDQQLIDLIESDLHRC
jgi:hypothetical protein